MKQHDVIELIDRYYSSDLNKHEEAVLFSSLASDLQSREYFKHQQLLATALAISTEDVPESVDRLVLSGIPVAKNNPIKYKLPLRLIAVAASIIIIFCISVLYLFGQVTEARKELYNLNYQVKEQHETIEMLYNSLPTVTVSSNYSY